jgi:hypothetical protein
MTVSSFYNLSVEQNSNFQKASKTWDGFHSFDYIKQLKDVFNHFNVKTLLDYGCGKGRQYAEKRIYEEGTEPMTFDQYLGVDVYKYDPCVDSFKIPPAPGQKFDAVILIQVLPYIPDDDINWVKDVIMSHTDKVCFIGQIDCKFPISRKKQNLLNPEWFKEKRTNDWYFEKFSNWNESKLVWWFRDGESTYINNWLENDIKQL